MSVTGHYLPHPGDSRQPGQPGAVVAERVLRHRVQQRYLDVRAHVTGHEDTGVGQEHRAVAGRVPVVHDQLGLGPVPRDHVRVERREPPEQGDVMARRGLLRLAGQLRQLSLGERGRGRGRVPGRAS